MRRIFIVIVALAGLVAVASATIEHRSEPVTIGATPAPVPKEPGAGLPSRHQEFGRTARIDRPSVWFDASSWRSYWRPLINGDRKAAFDGLAERGAPFAAKIAAELARSCGPYADHTYAYTRLRIEAGNQPVGIKSKQTAVAEQQRKSCVGFNVASMSMESDLEQWVNRSGDLHAFAFNMPAHAPTVELIEKAKAAAALQDPIALHEVAAFFMRRADTTSTSTYDLGNDLFVTRNIIRDALYLAACDLGDDCGPASPQVAAGCVNMGWCEAASLGEMFSAYSYSPADADLLLRTRDVVLSGVRVEQWPTGFWQPLGYDIYSDE